MSELFQQAITPALIEAVEANLCEEMACLSRGMPGGEVYEDAELLRVFTGPGNGPNGVLRARFQRHDRAYVEAKVNAIIDFFAQRQLPSMFWSVGQSSLPADLDAILRRQSFRRGKSTQALLLSTESVNTESLTPPGFFIQEIEDVEALAHLKAIEVKGFGSSQEYAQHYYDGYLKAGFGKKNTKWHHFLGWLDHAPVAIASLLLHEGIAGIYGVATIPQARRQGIGAAMTLHAIHEARALGYSNVTLAPTDMSERIYRRIGFQDCCTVWHYALPLTL